jgi:butyrate kinase
MKEFEIFAINPGSTSTKIALFKGDKCLFSKNVPHDAETLKQFPTISDQLAYRRNTITALLDESGVRLDAVDAFVGRGGGLMALEGGTYNIDDLLLDHARRGANGIQHPANLGSQLAYDFAQTFGGRAFVVNPPDVDEFELVARITGLSEVTRESRIHALNQKEIGIRYAGKIGRRYEDLNLVISHIGGGVSVTAHKNGRMIDSNDNVNGDGPTRAGSIPAVALIKMCFSGKYSEKELYGLITKNGGLVDLLGTANVREVLDRIKNGDGRAKIVYDAMCYQIGKYIGAYAATLCGKVDAIILTGGIANDDYLVDQIKKMVGFIAPVVVMPGEFEMEAMASGAIRVLSGQEKTLSYTGIPVWDGVLKTNV